MTLVQIGKLNETQAREYLENIRWPEGPSCPHCQSNDATRLQGKAHRPGTIQCNACRQQYSVTVGSIMEDSHIPLVKWIMAYHLICSSKKGISALQLQRNLGLGSYRTAWHLAHRIRHSMKSDPMQGLLGGNGKVVEADETYVGPRRVPGKRGRGAAKKTPVVALVERNGRVRAKPIANVTGATLKQAIRDNVHRDSTINTDELSSYGGLQKEFAGHETVNHSRKEYARNGVSVNACESYFALLKRGIMGSFHHVSPQHLHRYCDEFSFRWDNRKIGDESRTIQAIKQAEGKRLTLFPV